MKKLTAISSVALLAGCASYDGRGLIVGQSSLDEVTQVMGPPAMQWTEANGLKQLAYPRGPAGVHTYMVRVGADGKLLGIENVMDIRTFAAVREGMSGDEVTADSWAIKIRLDRILRKTGRTGVGLALL